MGRRSAVAGLLLVLPATSANAERLACALSAPCPAAVGCAAPLHLRFNIDRSQFLLPAYPDDPPRRLVTRVETADGAYPAEPIVMADGTRGFHAERAGHAVLLTIALDGTAIYTDSAGARSHTGTCEEIEP